MTGSRPGPIRDRAAGKAHRAEAWSTAITATTAERVFVRGVALDEAIGREPFPAVLLRLWRGDAPTEVEAGLLGACLVASIDHGPLAPSALVTRTIASTQATPMAGLAGGVLAFGELHGAVVSRAMRILPVRPPRGRWTSGPTKCSRPSAPRGDGSPASVTAGTDTIFGWSGSSRSPRACPTETTRPLCGRSPRA